MGGNISNVIFPFGLFITSAVDISLPELRAGLNIFSNKSRSLTLRRNIFSKEVSI